jgi:hypothetical protein
LGGASQLFTMVFDTVGSGTVSFNAAVQGNDSNNNSVTQSGSVNSPSVVIQSPVSLSSQFITPSFATRDQNFTTLLKITNSGQAAAMNVLPSTVDKSGAGSVLPVSGPSPSSVSLVAGASVWFTYVYNAAGTGLITFSARASAQDQNTGTTYFSVPAIASTLEQNHLALSVSSLVASPTNVGTGADFTVVMTVANGAGAATAVAITPSAALGIIGSGITPNGGPFPASFASLNGGSSTAFTYIFTANLATPAVSVSGNATAFDANHAGVSTTAAYTVSNNVSIFAQGRLAPLSFTVQPAGPISTGQLFTVVLSVTNNGQGSILTTTASTLLQSGGGSASVVSVPQPVTGIAQIVNGQGRSFTYVYLASGAGQLSFSGSANGFDLSSAPISSGLTSTTAVLIQNAVSLSVSAQPLSSTVSVGQVFDVNVFVSNTAAAPGATANLAAPISVQSVVPGLATYLNGPVPASMSLLPGASQISASRPTPRASRRSPRLSRRQIQTRA